MGELADTTRSRVPAGLSWPEPLDALCRWIDDHGSVTRGDDDELYGALHADDVGTDIQLRGWTADEVAAGFWSVPSVADLVSVVWPFCQTGFDGSYAALWDDDGTTRLVHLGSGSGSMLTCVLVDDPVDFLRLLAIGYEEVCWNDDWAAPPEPDDDRETLHVAFRDWVTTTYGVEIPATGLEVVPEPAELGDESDDPFCRLIDRLHAITDLG